MLIPLNVGIKYKYIKQMRYQSDLDICFTMCVCVGRNDFLGRVGELETVGIDTKHSWRFQNTGIIAIKSEWCWHQNIL